MCTTSIPSICTLTVLRIEFTNPDIKLSPYHVHIYNVANKAIRIRTLICDPAKLFTLKQPVKSKRIQSICYYQQVLPPSITKFAPVI